MTLFVSLERGGSIGPLWHATGTNGDAAGTHSSNSMINGTTGDTGERKDLAFYVLKRQALVTGYEDPCHITWGMIVQVSRDSATASAEADAHSQTRRVCKICEGLWCEDGIGATELVRKSRNVSRTRVATLNVGTLMGRSCELVEALERKRVDLCAVQETRWSCRKSRDIGRGFKAVLCGSPRTTSGLGVIVSERFRDSIVRDERFDDRLMKISGCSDQGKEQFWSLIDDKTADVLPKDVIIVAGDLNGHVGVAKDGYSCHGSFGYGSRNADGERIFEYAKSHNLTTVNTVFRNRDSHLISHYNGSSKSQIDFVLVKDRDRSIVTDAKVVPYETVAPQHRPLIYTLKIAPPRLKQVERCGAARIKRWRMREKEAAVISRVWLPTVTTVDETRKKATDAIPQAAESELGTTKPGRRKVDKQTWLWTYDVKAKVREKKSLYRMFLGEKTADNWRKYQKAKKAAKKAVAVAKATHYSDVNEKLESRDGERYLYRLDKTRHRHTENIEKLFGINDEGGHLLTDHKKALKRWRDYFEEISTVEFPHPDVLRKFPLWNFLTRTSLLLVLLTVPFTRSPCRKQKRLIRR
ncbi:unnamed protein product [Heligmosomoides polygyrus]|uniref:Reverse transcriptase domain-containing protein n=1 Tax=Heligmosomoides polygyrus TaxID=6339 RepID=A0A183GSW1_HELPZ|nr:unnamed protein product [Heligmosomoides polygyrus]